MTRTIRKHHFESGTQIAPIGHVRLVDYQGDGSERPTIWIEFDISREDPPLCEYFIRATGDIFKPGKHDDFVGSANCGRYVWHVYRRPLS